MKNIKETILTIIALFGLLFSIFIFGDKLFKEEMILTMFLCAMTLITSIMVTLVLAKSLPGNGCGGDCKQGRLPCNCRKYYDKIKP